MSKYRVCPLCRGEGKTVHPAVSVWTGADIAEDPDGFEGMLAGDYDVPCPRCNGLRVVTKESERKYAEDRADHFTMLRESGIYPGSPDWF